MLSVKQLRLGEQDNSAQTATLPGYRVDLAVESGECVGLWGESGVGKSLLLRAIADMDPHQGAICLDGRDQQSMSGPAWRRLVQWVPAESAWWSDRVGDHFRDDVQTDLGCLGFDESALNWQVSRLSSGERQRLSMLRSWQLRPRVWLLDEPSSSLDDSNVQRMEDWVAQLIAQQDLAVVWVSHDRRQLDRVADRVFQLTPKGLVSDQSTSLNEESSG